MIIADQSKCSYMDLRREARYNFYHFKIFTRPRLLIENTKFTHKTETSRI